MKKCAYCGKEMVLVPWDGKLYDVITFLPNWENSKGANVERAYVTYIEKPILHLEFLAAY